MGKLCSQKFPTEKEVSPEKCKDTRSTVHLKRVLQVKLRLSLFGSTLTACDLALSAVNEEREGHLCKAVLSRENQSLCPPALSNIIPFLKVRTNSGWLQSSQDYSEFLCGV